MIVSGEMLRNMVMFLRFINDNNHDDDDGSGGCGWYGRDDSVAFFCLSLFKIGRN